MSHLIDVSFLLACGWSSHPRHGMARVWLENQKSFYTCALTELGFVRVSMSPAYRSSFDDAKNALAEILELRGAAFLSESISAVRLPPLTSHSDVTDAYLVELAKSNRLRLATLDDALCRKSWASIVAVNPL